MLSLSISVLRDVTCKHGNSPLFNARRTDPVELNRPAFTRSLGFTNVSVPSLSISFSMMFFWFIFPLFLNFNILSERRLCLIYRLKHLLLHRLFRLSHRRLHCFCQMHTFWCIHVFCSLKVLKFVHWRSHTKGKSQNPCYSTAESCNFLRFFYALLFLA